MTCDDQPDDVPVATTAVYYCYFCISSADCGPGGVGPPRAAPREALRAPRVRGTVWPPSLSLPPPLRFSPKVRAPKSPFTTAGSSQGSRAHARTGLSTRRYGSLIDGVFRVRLPTARPAAPCRAAAAGIWAGRRRCQEGEGISRARLHRRQLRRADRPAHLDIGGVLRAMVRCEELCRPPRPVPPSVSGVRVWSAGDCADLSQDGGLLPCSHRRCGHCKSLAPEYEK
eukprot:scaffold2017_cov387-Prasinococcus_capsulatus_cf.AAC.11